MGEAKRRKQLGLGPKGGKGFGKARLKANPSKVPPGLDPSKFLPDLGTALAERDPEGVFEFAFDGDILIGGSVYPDRVMVQVSSRGLISISPPVPRMLDFLRGQIVTIEHYDDNPTKAKMEALKDRVMSNKNFRLTPTVKDAYHDKLGMTVTPCRIIQFADEYKNDSTDQSDVDLAEGVEEALQDFLTTDIADEYSFPVVGVDYNFLSLEETQYGYKAKCTVWADLEGELSDGYFVSVITKLENGIPYELEYTSSEGTWDFIETQ